MIHMVHCSNCALRCSNLLVGAWCALRGVLVGHSEPILLQHLSNFRSSVQGCRSVQEWVGVGVKAPLLITNFTVGIGSGW